MLTFVEAKSRSLRDKLQSRFIGVVIISFFFIGCSKGIKTSRIEFKERDFDFGEIAQEDQVIHIFKFKNVGGDTLIINNVRTP